MPARLFDPDRWRLLSPHVDRALELAGDEREAWLAGLRAQDPEVAEDVVALLAQRETLSQEGFLAGGATTWTTPSLVGQTIGAYTLRGRIGQGGMGTVWRAERSDGRFQGQAAVKLLNLGLLSHHGQERFRREGSMLARLAHPGIARLLDAGVSPAGQPFLVLEYVEGRRIDTFAEDERLDARARVELVLQVLAAVGHAHANLIVHRDIKPSNILVTADGTAKLLDFGIGKLLSVDPTDPGDQLTRDDRVLTLEYAAPEQIRGGDITTATDTHAIGLLLYELLTGRSPYPRAGRTRTDFERLLCEEPPTRPSQLARDLRGDLDAILMKALRKEPERRYPSAAALEDDLRRYLEGRPVLAQPDTATYRVRKFAARHRTGVAAAAALVLLVAVGVARERTLRARAEEEARKAAAVKDYLVSVFEVSDPFGRPDPHAGDTSARALLDRGAARVDEALLGQPDVQNELKGVLGFVYARLGSFESAVPLLRQSLADKRRLYGDHSRPVAEAAGLLGDALAELNRFDEAEPLLREAVAVRRDLLGPRDADTAHSIDRLATLLQDRNRFAEAETLFREALAIQRAAHGNDHREVAESLNNLGVFLYIRGHYDEAEPLYREAIAIDSRGIGENHPIMAITQSNLAQVQTIRGRVDEAIAMYRKSLVTKERVLDPAHPNMTVHLNNLGITLALERHQLGEAETLIRKALAGDRKTFGPSHSYVAESLDNLGTVLRLKGEFDGAERTYREALEINRTLFGPEHVRVAKNLGNLGMTRDARGDLAGAIDLYRQSLALFGRFVADTHARYVTIQTQLARALRESGRASEAEPLLRALVGRLDPASSAQRGGLVQAEVELARTLVALGRAAEAKPIVEKALPLARERFGERDWRTGDACLALGECLAALHDEARAEPLLRDAAERLDGQRLARPRLVRSAAAALAGVEKTLARASSSATNGTTH